MDYGVILCNWKNNFPELNLADFSQAGVYYRVPILNDMCKFLKVIAAVDPVCVGVCTDHIRKVFELYKSQKCTYPQKLDLMEFEKAFHDLIYPHKKS